MSNTTQEDEPGLVPWLLVLANALEAEDEEVERDVRRHLAEYGIGFVVDREVFRRRAARGRRSGRRRHA